jgi:Predicted ATP-grasp enzyme
MERKNVSSGFEQKRVLIIDGGSRQALPLIHGFRKLGCYVAAYCGSKLDVGYNSHFTNEKILSVFELSDEEKTYKAIKLAIDIGNYDLVVPTNDFAAKIISKHKEQFDRKTFISVNDWNVFNLAYDKSQTMRICMENNIPCPKTFCCDELNITDANFNFPLVIKPKSSYGANGFFIVHNKTEFERYYRPTEEKFGELILQEYISQTGRQYQVEMFMDDNGVCKSFVLMSKLRWYPLAGGSSTFNETLCDPVIKANCIKLLKLLGWRGYASLDLIEDPRDGTAKILEINPRINGTVKICFDAGIDICVQHLEQALELPVTQYGECAPGHRLRYLHMDVLWFLKSKERFSCKPSWFDFSHGTDEIWYADDPFPWFSYSLQSIGKLFKDRKKRSVSVYDGGRNR